MGSADHHELKKGAYRIILMHCLHFAALNWTLAWLWQTIWKHVFLKKFSDTRHRLCLSLLKQWYELSYASWDSKCTSSNAAAAMVRADHTHYANHIAPSEQDTLHSKCKTQMQTCIMHECRVSVHIAVWVCMLRVFMAYCTVNNHTKHTYTYISACTLMHTLLHMHTLNNLVSAGRTSGCLFGSL